MSPKRSDKLHIISHTLLLLTLGYLLATASLAASERPKHTGIENFPSINQREIKGANFRCGTIALGSWILWLTEEKGLPTPEGLRVDPSHPFSNSTLPENTKAMLTHLDTLAGGESEIMLSRMIETLVEYAHQLPDETLKTTIHYYNLPSEAFLRNLQAQAIPVILFHGIYETDLTTGLLRRTKGHYTCLIGQDNQHLIANTYAMNYRFHLSDLPMTLLDKPDRYKPSGLESVIYLRRPEQDYPRYRFRSFAAQDKDHAKLQLNTGGQIFTEPNEIILLEGALIFQISDTSEK